MGCQLPSVTAVDVAIMIASILIFPSRHRSTRRLPVMIIFPTGQERPFQDCYWCSQATLTSLPLQRRQNRQLQFAFISLPSSSLFAHGHHNLHSLLIDPSTSFFIQVPAVHILHPQQVGDQIQLTFHEENAFHTTRFSPRRHTVLPFVSAALLSGTKSHYPVYRDTTVISSRQCSLALCTDEVAFEEYRVRLKSANLSARIQSSFG